MLKKLGGWTGVLVWGGLLGSFAGVTALLVRALLHA